MKFWRAVLNIIGIVSITVGILLFLVLAALNDPEIEGPAADAGAGIYFIPLIPIFFGGIILFLQKKAKM